MNHWVTVDQLQVDVCASHTSFQ